jgi:hypothetical protein
MPTVTATWNGATADWNTPTDWSGGIVPDDGNTDVLLAGAGTYTISIATDENFTVGTALLNNAKGTLDVAGILDDSGPLTINAGSVQVQGGGEATIGAAVTNAGTFGLHDSGLVTVDGSFANSASHSLTTR